MPRKFSLAAVVALLAFSLLLFVLTGDRDDGAPEPSAPVAGAEVAEAPAPVAGADTPGETPPDDDLQLLAADAGSAALPAHVFAGGDNSLPSSGEHESTTESRFDSTVSTFLASEQTVDDWRNLTSALAFVAEHESGTVKGLGADLWLLGSMKRLPIREVRATSRSMAEELVEKYVDFPEVSKLFWDGYGTSLLRRRELVELAHVVAEKSESIEARARSALFIAIAKTRDLSASVRYEGMRELEKLATEFAGVAFSPTFSFQEACALYSKGLGHLSVGEDAAWVGGRDIGGIRQTVGQHAGKVLVVYFVANHEEHLLGFHRKVVTHIEAEYAAGDVVPFVVSMDRHVWDVGKFLFGERVLGPVVWDGSGCTDLLNSGPLTTAIGPRVYVIDKRSRVHTVLRLPYFEGVVEAIEESLSR